MRTFPPVGRRALGSSSLLQYWYKKSICETAAFDTHCRAPKGTLAFSNLGCFFWCLQRDTLFHPHCLTQCFSVLCPEEDSNPSAPQHRVSGLQAASGRWRRRPWRLILPFGRRALRKFKSFKLVLKFLLWPRRLELPCLSALAPQNTMQRISFYNNVIISMQIMSIVIKRNNGFSDCISDWEYSLLSLIGIKYGNHSCFNVMRYCITSEGKVLYVTMPIYCQYN